MEGRKTCYYEVLAVEMDATEEQLNKAYKKGALKWHPDRNMHQQEVATVKFKELRNAFETLKDPNERAWYDGHREQILRGGDGTGAGNAEDLDISLWEYMNSSCYEGMGDGEEVLSPTAAAADEHCCWLQGFYGVYGEVFDQVIPCSTVLLRALSQPPNQPFNQPCAVGCRRKATSN